jgi:acetyltransferase-like isoleucine patch superfamily enzyme
VRHALAAALHWSRAWAADVGAIGSGDPRARRFGAFGWGSCLVFPQGTIYNERYIHIGDGTIVGPGTCLTAGMAPGQAMASDPVVRIGDRCVIGRGSHVVGHWSIDIGDDIQTGPYVYITDQNHSYTDPDVPIGLQWPVEAPVRIGSGSWLGANVVVLPGADIGAHVVVAAGSVVRGTIPDHSVAAGVPAQVIRRWEPAEGWLPVPPPRPAPPATKGAGAGQNGGLVPAEADRGTVRFPASD